MKQTFHIKRKYLYLFLIIFIIYSVINSNTKKPLVNLNPTPTPTPIISPTFNNIEKTKVIRIVDGDTIVIEGDKKLRYIGIDTPETKDPNKDIQCFGVEASKKNEELILNKEIYIEKDVSNVDKYKRLLRYVWLDDPTSSPTALFVNDYLVRQGYARLSTYPPDVKYVERFRQAETEARENKRGLWSSCQETK